MSEEQHSYNQDNDNSGLTIGDVGHFQRDFAERITDLTYEIQRSLIRDKPMHNHTVGLLWRDEFLTNVIVPFLNRIMETEVITRREIETWYDDRAQTQGGAVVKQELDDTNARIESLFHTIHVLKEWRG